MATVWAARPSSSFGYWRGAGADGPLAQGQGSGMGQANQGVGIMPPGYASQGAGGWSPTVVYLLIFVVVEMILMKCFERLLR